MRKSQPQSKSESLPYLVAVPLADSADPPLTEYSLYLLSQLGRAGKRRLTEQLASHGLTMRDMASLAVLEESGPVSQAELGRRLGLDPKDVSVLVDDMCRRDLAERTVDSTDRRRRLIGSTSQGAAALETARRVTGRVDDELLGPLPSAARESLHRMLLELLTHVRSPE